MIGLECEYCGEVGVGSGSPVPAGPAPCACCGTYSVWPAGFDAGMVELWNRANRLRIGLRFDEALAIHESVLRERGPIAEFHWGAVLARFGVVHERSDDGGTWIPRCHLVIQGSFLNDPDFLQAMESAPGPEACAHYADLGRRIARVQAGAQAEPEAATGSRDPDDLPVSVDEIRSALRSGWLHLEARDFHAARVEAERVLASEPANGEAFWLRVLAELRVPDIVSKNASIYLAYWLKALQEIRARQPHDAAGLPRLRTGSVPGRLRSPLPGVDVDDPRVEALLREWEVPETPSPVVQPTLPPDPGVVSSAAPAVEATASVPLDPDARIEDEAATALEDMAVALEEAPRWSWAPSLRFWRASRTSRARAKRTRAAVESHLDSGQSRSRARIQEQLLQLDAMVAEVDAAVARSGRAMFLAGCMGVVVLVSSGMLFRWQRLETQAQGSLAVATSFQERADRLRLEVTRAELLPDVSACVPRVEALRTEVDAESVALGVRLAENGTTTARMALRVIRTAKGQASDLQEILSLRFQDVGSRLLAPSLGAIRRWEAESFDASTEEGRLAVQLGGHVEQGRRLLTATGEILNAIQAESQAGPSLKAGWEQVQGGIRQTLARLEQRLESESEQARDCLIVSRWGLTRPLVGGSRIQLGSITARWIPAGRSLPEPDPKQSNPPGWKEGFFWPEPGDLGSPAEEGADAVREAADLCRALTRRHRNQGLLTERWEWRMPSESERRLAMEWEWERLRNELAESDTTGLAMTFPISPVSAGPDGPALPWLWEAPGGGDLPGLDSGSGGMRPIRPILTFVP